MRARSLYRECWRAVKARPPLLVVLLLSAACGASPTTPSPAERVAGVWVGHATLAAVSGGTGGGECVSDLLQRSLGGRDVFAAPVQRIGTDIGATISYQGNPISCAYTGAANGSSLNLSLVSCKSGVVTGLACADGSRRDLQLRAATIAATVSNGSGGGAETATWDVLVRGASTPLATLTTRTEFTWNVLGLPASDFHVFDGSILPGYVDGTVTIPEEPNPFCTRCGWFMAP